MRNNELKYFLDLMKNDVYSIYPLSSINHPLTHGEVNGRNNEIRTSIIKILTCELDVGLECRQKSSAVAKKIREN